MPHLKRQFSYLTLLLFSLTVLACARSAPRDSIPEHQLITLSSKILQEDRTISVWLPPGYESSAASFPVVYMPDGGIGEDFPHIANTLAEMIAAKKIAPLILVGIENTVRGRDLTPGSQALSDERYAPLSDGAAAFAGFIGDELMPKIDKQFRTTNERAIVGESLAGLFVMDSFARRPQMFERYIAFDPSLWWDNHSLASKPESLGRDFPDQATKLFFAGSSAEDIYLHTRTLEGVLNKENLKQLDWRYVEKPEQSHSTIFRSTKEEAFAWALWPAKQ